MMKEVIFAPHVLSVQFVLRLRGCVSLYHVITQFGSHVIATKTLLVMGCTRPVCDALLPTSRSIVTMISASDRRFFRYTVLFDTFSDLRKTHIACNESSYDFALCSFSTLS